MACAPTRIWGGFGVQNIGEVHRELMRSAEESEEGTTKQCGQFSNGSFLVQIMIEWKIFWQSLKTKDVQFQAVWVRYARLLFR